MISTVPAPMLDVGHFKMMTGGDAALQSEIAGLFRGQVGQWRALLAPGADPSVWRDSAHTLKGSARGIGLWTLGEACERAEQADPAAAPAALAAVQALLDTALCELAPY
jgi:hypothetical protein